ncbi:MAG TPA: hypothetical protein DIT25_02860 [Candidatus Moranbacteria bacterium]|nr:hypothetical protein [Candidatus Moranbacteria bacterium]
MLLKIRPVLFTLIFFASLETIVFFGKYVFFIMAFLFFLSLYEGRKIGGRLLFSILPAFFVLSSVALLYLIGLPYEEQIFIVLASGMYYLSLFSAYRLGKYSGDQTARGMNMAAASATIFFTYASSYGLYLNFLVPLHYLMIVYMSATLLVSFQYFAIIRPGERKKVWMYSFVLALAMAEIVWTMNFWPFGYLTSGVIALILYYVLWDLVQSYFLGSLSRHRVISNGIFFSFLVALVLLTSKWIPVL